MTNYEKLLNLIKENFPEIENPEVVIRSVNYCDCLGFKCPIGVPCTICPNNNFWNEEYQNKTKEEK